MSLKILSAEEKGDVKNEYLRIKVVKDCNLKHYAIHDNTYSEGKISNELEHFFQLPDLEVKSGEFVRLYTKKGVYGNYISKTENKVHNLFWGLGKPVWNKDGDKATLMEVQVVQSLAV